MMDVDLADTPPMSHRPLILLGIIFLATWIHSAQVVLFLLGFTLFTLGTAIGSKRETERKYRE